MARPFTLTVDCGHKHDEAIDVCRSIDVYVQPRKALGTMTSGCKQGADGRWWVFAYLDPPRENKNDVGSATESWAGAVRGFWLDILRQHKTFRAAVMGWDRDDFVDEESDICREPARWTNGYIAGVVV